MRVSFYFERSCPEPTLPSRCIEAARAPLEQALDPGRPRPRRGSRERVVESWSWSRGKWQAAGAISVVGKAVLTLHPPLRPLSHNINPRDGGRGPGHRGKGSWACSRLWAMGSLASSCLPQTFRVLRAAEDAAAAAAAGAAASWGGGRQPGRRAVPHSKCISIRWVLVLGTGYGVRCVWRSGVWTSQCQDVKSLIPSVRKSRWARSGLCSTAPAMMSYKRPNILMAVSRWL
jgi:hypothetical protein